jgi:UDP-N-acetylglucosamine--N-acetylmuramyl-(pentapeptide) pyrophosphoryl-undecaprenol N-acetylglucosamine transferase
MSGAVVIAAGGTGGHIFPAQSLAQELGKRGRKVVLMTDDRGHNYAQAFPQAEIVTVPSATFAGRGTVGKAFAVLRLARGAMSAYFALGRVKPAVVVGFGGYPALPTMFAAARRGVPSIIHEQNAILGRVNRWLAPAVTRIASSFEKLSHMDPLLAPRVVRTGNPVRPPSWRPRGLMFGRMGAGGSTYSSSAAVRERGCLRRSYRRRLRNCPPSCGRGSI